MNVNTVINQDCLTGLKELPSGSIDLTVTSPPYDGLRTYDGFSFNFRAIAHELHRVTKPGGVVVWNVGDQTKNGSESGTSFRQALYFMDECGFNLHDTMIFQKVNYVPLTHNRYEQSFEYVFILSKGKPKAFNPIRVEKRTESKPGKFWKKAGDKATTEASSPSSERNDKIAPNIFPYTVGGGKTGHPAPFPLQFALDHITSWSNQGDVVLDPFMGSGTTALAAIELNRHYIGYEMSEDYHAKCLLRLAQPSTVQTEAVA